MTVTVKHGDKYPTVWVANMDLTGATVRLLAKPRYEGDTVVLASSITDAVAGEVTHVLTGTLEPGSYDVELEVSRGDEVVTFPSESYERLTVVRDLD